MNLTKSQGKYLRKLAQNLKSIILIGQNGLTGNIVDELESALDHHEIVKVKIRVGDREARDRIIISLCDKGRAALVQKVGNTVTLYRKNKGKPGIVFS